MTIDSKPVTQVLATAEVFLKSNPTVLEHFRSEYPVDWLLRDVFNLALLMGFFNGLRAGEILESSQWDELHKSLGAVISSNRAAA